MPRGKRRQTDTAIPHHPSPQCCPLAVPVRVRPLTVAMIVRRVESPGCLRVCIGCWRLCCIPGVWPLAPRISGRTHALRGAVKVFFPVFQDAFASFWMSEEPRRWSARHPGGLLGRAGPEQAGPRAFRRLATRLACAPDTILYFDDEATSVPGAREAGLSALLLCS